MASSYDYLWKALAVACLAYYVLSPPPVLCASDEPGTVCRNVTQQIVVNETTEEWCAVLSSAYCYFYDSCYCNVTREVPKTHVTTICEDPENAKKGALGGVFKNLTDPEVAAIAVISSLLFSIILSLTVFFIQRRHRGCVARKEARAQVVQVQRADCEQPEGNAEGDAFLPSSQEQRYINVQPANVAQNVYEQVPQHPPADKAELSLDKEKLSASYVSKPAAASSPEIRDSRPPPTQPVVTPCVPSTSKQNAKSNEPPSFELVVKSPEQPPVSSSQKSLHNAPEKKEEDVTSTSSLRLNLSEDHYESLAPADT